MGSDLCSVPAWNSHLDIQTCLTSGSVEWHPLQVDERDLGQKPQQGVKQEMQNWPAKTTFEELL